MKTTLRIAAVLALVLPVACGPISSPENEDGDGNSPTFGGYGDSCAQTSNCGLGLLCASGGTCGDGKCCRLDVGGMLAEPHDAGVD